MLLISWCTAHKHVCRGCIPKIIRLHGQNLMQTDINAVQTGLHSVEQLVSLKKCVWNRNENVHTGALYSTHPWSYNTGSPSHHTYISFMMSVSLQLRWFSFATSLHFTQYLVTFYLFTLNIMVHNDFSLIKKGGGGTFCGSTACRVCVCVLLYIY